MSELSLETENSKENLDKELEKKEVSEVKKDEKEVKTETEVEEKLEKSIPEKVEEEVVNQEETEKESDDIDEIEEIEETLIEIEDDLSEYSKKDFVVLASKLLDAANSRSLTISDIRNIDNVSKSIRAGFDELITLEIEEAKKAYLEETGSEDGFEYKNDNQVIRLEGILIQIKEKRQEFYKNLEKEREDNFEVKTKLLDKLREIVEEEEKGGSRSNWESFKQLQADWKEAGNVNSPHNGTLWSTYNALVDRYFDIRSIQHELKELDRRKNLEAKEEVVVKIEEIAASLATLPINNEILKNANTLLQDYKDIGPGPRAEQDLLWERLKKAFDIIYDKKRELQKESDELAEEVYKAKSQLYENLQPFVSFDSESINEWNAQTKDVMEIQKQWESIKGRMPRDRAKDLSSNFWKSIKQFYRNKSAFFARLEKKRESNYEAKLKLVEEAKAILETGNFEAANTNKIIELQKKWRTIGYVPEKYKDSIYKKFKGICDEFFDNKRAQNKTQIDEYKKNLEEKEQICAEMGAAVESGETSVDKLNEYKKRFNAIGFVPRKDIKTIKNKFVTAVNKYVRALTNIDKTQKDKLILQNEAEVMLRSTGNLNKKEHELRSKIRALEDEIALTRNNLSFFEFSKNADKLIADYQKKIKKSEKLLEELNAKLKLIHAVNK